MYELINDTNLYICMESLHLCLMNINNLLNNGNNGLNGIGIVLIIYVVSMLYYIYWIRDGIREYTSTYIILILMISISMVCILVTESIIFATMFISMFQPLYCYLYSLEGIYITDPHLHTYSNTIILSSSGVSLGYFLVLTNVLQLYILVPLYQWIIVLTFLHIQISELCNITVYINECLYISMFFTLLGLHLFHILIGILLIVLILWNSCYSRSILTFTPLQILVTSYQLSSTLQLVYWHFVDILWLFIYYILYN